MTVESDLILREALTKFIWVSIEGLKPVYFISDENKCLNIFFARGFDKENYSVYFNANIIIYFSSVTKTYYINKGKIIISYFNSAYKKFPIKTRQAKTKSLDQIKWIRDVHLISILILFCKNKTSLALLGLQNEIFI